MADTLLQRHATAQLVFPKLHGQTFKMEHPWPGCDLGVTYPPSLWLSHISCPHWIQVPAIWGTGSIPNRWPNLHCPHVRGPATFQDIGQIPSTKSLVPWQPQHFIRTFPLYFLFMVPIYISNFRYYKNVLKDWTYFPFILFYTPWRD